MKGFVGVRKGAWTEEEDVLLKQCIESYGEGEWHRIPLRTGLKRCRKSCRLRWLNYLKPDIKRSRFEEDEIDLMIKLHKLLGNRWSLIAGRLPGRTANDVKNFWNTHLRKNEESSRERETSKISKSLSRHEIIRPHPRTFSKSFILRCQKALLEEFNRRKEQPTISCPSPSPSPTPCPTPSPTPCPTTSPSLSQVVAAVPQSPENKEWWETVFAEVVEEQGEGNNGNETISVGGPDLEQPLKTSGEVGDCVFEETQWDWWRGMEFDVGNGLDLL